MEITPKRWPKVSAVRMPHSAMPSTGLVGDLARGMQAGIGIAGDDEGRAVVVALPHHAADRRHDLLDMGLASSMPGGPFFQGDAFDGGPPVMRSGSMAASMPWVTASVELGLMTRMRSDMGRKMAPKLLFNNA